MANVIFKQGLASEYAALATKDFSTFYRTTDTNELYWGSKKITNAADLEALITRLDGDENTLNSIRNVVAGYISGLDTVSDVTIASQSGKAISIAAGISESDGVIGAGSGTAITLADVASTGKAEDIEIDDDGDLLTATDVEGALAELAGAIADATDAGAVTCETSSPATGDILRTYSFYQGVLGTDDAAAKAAKKIVDVNVPRDYLVKEAEVKTVTTADDPYTGAVVGDKYIDFTVNTKDSLGTATHLYIPVDDLMSAISGSTGAEITVAISSDNQISATVNKIAATKIIYREADNTDPEHPVTEQTVKQKIDVIDATIAAMDANLDASGTAQHSGTFVLSGVTQVDGVITAVDSVEVEAAGAAAAAVAALDATADSTKTSIDGSTARTAQNNGVFALQALTETDGKLASMTAVEVDPAGAAATAKSEVIGTGTGRTGSGTDLDPYVYADTIKGVKTLIADTAADAAAAVADLDSTAGIASKSGNVVTIKTGLVQTDGVVTNDSGTDIVLEDVAVSGASVDVSVTDSGNYFTGSNVEAILQEVGQQLTWQSI